MPNPNLIAEHLTDGWTVLDPTGGRWWPNAGVASLIAASPDPAMAAIQICDSDPMSGRWSA